MSITAKLFILSMFVALEVNATVITYRETFNMVSVIAPAKSKQIICKTRVDLNEGLVDNSRGCDIDYIEVYNKNDMWIGSLDGVEAGMSTRYSDFDNHRYKGKGVSIRVQYTDIIPDAASNENKELASCPNGMIVYIDDGYFKCKKPFSCPTGMYAIDSANCAELFEGSHRNPTTGFSCNKGYIKTSDGYCEKKVTCGETEVYNKYENVCLIRPEHSYWVKNTYEWKCDDGYIKQGDDCEKITACDSISRYYAPTNSCVSLPAFAFWADSISSEWVCNNGYIRKDEECIKKAVCSEEQRYDNIFNICIDPFPHSIWTGHNDEYVCETGYVERGYGNCEKIPDCTHYNADDNTCYEKPSNSHWLYSWGNEWECDDGFHTGYGNCFKCAGETQYNDTLGDCVAKPNNSHWVSEGEWLCNDGFVQLNGYCEEKISCGWFERYNENNNTCVSKPSHSHWTNGWNYECDDGYYENYGECVEINPIHLSDYTKFFHSLTFFVGGGDAKNNHDVSTTLFNGALEYNIGVRVGAEFFNVRPQAMIGLLYSGFDYSSTQSYGYSDESVYSTALAVGIGVGVDIWHFTIDYNYLYAERETLNNVDFYSTLHQFKVGYNFNEHWNVNIATITQLIKTTTVLKEYDNTIYNIGVSYVF